MHQLSEEQLRNSDTLCSHAFRPGKLRPVRCSFRNRDVLITISSCFLWRFATGNEWINQCRVHVLLEIWMMRKLVAVFLHDITIKVLKTAAVQYTKTNTRTHTHTHIHGVSEDDTHKHLNGFMAWGENWYFFFPSFTARQSMKQTSRMFPFSWYF